MTDKPIVTVVMLGMNRFSERDDDHPFDMSVLDGFTTLWLPQIEKSEKKNTTLFFEVGDAVDSVHLSTRRPKSDFVFIMGRGTAGSGSEESLEYALTEVIRNRGRDAYVQIIAKSYGVVDTLAALKRLKRHHIRFQVATMVLIDGYAPYAQRRKVSKKYGDERRFTIPENVKRCFNIVQRTEGFEGLLAGAPDDNRVQNLIMTNKRIKHYGADYYCAYSDGYMRELEVCHFNMEEIVSTVPSFKESGQYFTLNALLYRRMMNSK